MKKFITHIGIVAPLNIAHVDTDAIIPKQFLQKIDRTGFSDDLFYNWRFINGNKNKINKNFVLNKKKYINSSVLIARHNFGCGSSREHAVWALMDYGFKCIISSNFADIFYNNSFNNHLLLITLSDIEIDNIFDILDCKFTVQAFINLYLNYIIINNKKYIFKIDNFHRFCLLNGLDNIDLTLQIKNKIVNFERNIPDFLNKNK